jgi:hypothetical protein
MRNKGQDCHGKSSIQQEHSLHQQIRLIAMEEISKMLHMEHSFV